MSDGGAEEVEDRWIKLFERLIDPKNSTKEFLGRRTSPRRCRFCKQTAPAVTFRNEAHVVAETLGNRSLLSWEECDSCNAAGSVFENDLANVLFGSRLISMIRPKKPKVKYRVHSGSPAYVEAAPALRKLMVAPAMGDDSVRLRRIPGGYCIEIKVPKYRPANVVKALARMAFFVLPEEILEEFEHVRRWLQGEEVWPGPWFCMFPIRGEGTLTITGLQVFVPHENARSVYPPVDIRLAYGRFTLTTQIPNPSWMSPPVQLVQAGTRLTAAHDTVDEGLRHELVFWSDEIAAMPPPTHAEIAEVAYFRSLARARTAGPGDQLHDWLEAEQDILWKQLGIEAHERPR